MLWDFIDFTVHLFTHARRWCHCCLARKTIVEQSLATLSHNRIADINQMDDIKIGEHKWIHSSTSYMVINILRNFFLLPFVVKCGSAAMRQSSNTTTQRRIMNKSANSICLTFCHWIDVYVCAKLCSLLKYAKLSLQINLCLRTTHTAHM